MELSCSELLEKILKSRFDNLRIGGYKPGIISDKIENSGNPHGIVCNIRTNCSKQNIFCS